MKILSVIGVRPQFIKCAPVSRALRESGIEEIVVHTGQHHDAEMSDIFFEELGIRQPDHHLGIHGGRHGAMTGAMLGPLEDLMLNVKPGAVLVYGDTNSTLAGALAASKLHIPLIHVEAGLRSFNRRMPEEINRVCTDHLSSLLFCSSEEGEINLKAEGITRGVHIAGDVMADALLQARDDDSRLQARLERLTSPGERAEGYALLTAHRAENTDDPSRLAGLLEGFRQWGGKVIFPVHARTAKILQQLNMALPENIRAISPVGYHDLIALMLGSKMVATDSGGLQKEAYWAHRPCIILREETEWVEIVSRGWGVLTGTDSALISKALASPPASLSHPDLYGGDGGASSRIATILKSHQFDA